MNMNTPGIPHRLRPRRPHSSYTIGWLVEDAAVVQFIVCPKRQIGVGFECSSESDEMIAAAAGGVGECPEVTHSSAAASKVIFERWEGWCGLWEATLPWFGVMLSKEAFMYGFSSSVAQ